MSVRVVGYDQQGKRIVVDDGPGRGRVAGYGTGNLHSLTLVSGIGGSFVQGEPQEVERARKSRAEFERRHRA